MRPILQQTFYFQTACTWSEWLVPNIAGIPRSRSTSCSFLYLNLSISPDEPLPVASIALAELYGSCTGSCAISAMTPICSGRMRSTRRAWLDYEAWSRSAMWL